MRMLAYTRVSTAEQADNGHGLPAQRAAIEAEAARRGDWTLEWVEDRGVSAKSTRRFGLTYALARLDAGDADGLVVARLDRLSRSLLDLLTLLERAKRNDWKLVCLDPALDMTTAAGRLSAHVLFAVAEWERDIIRERTREGLAAARASGVRLGAPKGSAGAVSRLAPDVAQRIARERSEGRSFGAIARELNADGVPTALKGKEWHAATVRNVVLRLERAPLERESD
jgi:DNA invertase Pin-like site-specific DNA recombinase